MVMNIVACHKNLLLLQLEFILLKHGVPKVDIVELIMVEQVAIQLDKFS